MKQITAILVGAGGRGVGYGEYALKNPHDIKFVAVAEPREDRRKFFQKIHTIPDNMCFDSWEKLLNLPKIADCALICTQDYMHTEPALKALEQNYHILIEKPIAPTLEECFKIAEKANEKQLYAAVCHVLRYTPYYTKLKSLLEEEVIGKPVSVIMRENVGNIHQAHSFVRGNWRKSEETNPMIMSKCCHDLDLIVWLMNEKCVNISSYGDLTYFKTENAPENAPERCLDGCPEASKCPYYAPKVYTPDNWMTDILTLDKSPEAITETLKTSQYGRCVFKCDNDVVDHQSVNLAFESGLVLTLNMCALTENMDRETYIMGTKGELRGIFGPTEQYIHVTDFSTGNKTTIHFSTDNGHGGGDTGIMRSFVALLRGDTKINTTDINISILSHILAFAAEQSRLTHENVKLNDFVKKYKDNLKV